MRRDEKIEKIFYIIFQNVFSQSQIFLTDLSGSVVKSLCVSHIFFVCKKVEDQSLIIKIFHDVKILLEELSLNAYLKKVNPFC